MALDSLSLGDGFVHWRGFRADPANLPLPRPGVYRIVQLESGKCYIGISQNVERRLSNHAGGWARPPKLRSAIKKHGVGQFLVQPLYYSATRDTAHLPEIEADLIQAFDSIAHGYNIQAASGAVGPYGEVFSRAMTEVQNRPEVRARAAESTIRNGRHAAAMRSPEVRRRLSEATKATMALPGVRELMSEIGRECQMRPEVRAKKSAITKANHADPVIKELYRLTNYDDPDVKARKSLSIKLAMAGIAARRTGKRYITNGRDTKLVFPDTPLPDGWRYGMARINRKGVNSSSGYRGVQKLPGGRFAGRIRLGDEVVYLGSFDTAEEAYAKYCAVAEEFYGKVD